MFFADKDEEWSGRTVQPQAPSVSDVSGWDTSTQIRQQHNDIIRGNRQLEIARGSSSCGLSNRSRGNFHAPQSTTQTNRRGARPARGEFRPTRGVPFTTRGSLNPARTNVQYAQGDVKFVVEGSTGVNVQSPLQPPFLGFGTGQTSKRDHRIAGQADHVEFPRVMPQNHPRVVKHIVNNEQRTELDIQTRLWRQKPRHQLPATASINDTLL